MLFNVPFATGFGTGLYTPAGVPVRDDHPHDLLGRLRRDGAQDPRRGRLLHASSPTASVVSSGWRPASAARSPTRCSRSRCSAASPTSRNLNFNDWFGWDIPWSLFALFAALLISVLCYFDVELSVRVLGVALIGEVIILAIFDLLVFGQGGSDAERHRAPSSLNMFKLDRTRAPGLAAGVGLFFAFWSWVGFEAIPNYAEESQEPEEDRPAGDADLGRRRSASAT